MRHNSRKKNDDIAAHIVTREELAETKKENMRLRVLGCSQADDLEKVKEELAQVRLELLLANTGLGHFKSERDIHIKESETFVNESVEKIKSLSEKLERAEKVIIKIGEYLTDNSTISIRKIKEACGEYLKKERA